MEIDLITNICCELLECYTHTILKCRKIYPDNIFEQRSMYGELVYQSRHPDINNYIQTVIDNAKPLIKCGLAEKFIIALYTANGEIFDQIIINCSIDRDFLTTSDYGLKAEYILELERELLSVILKLQVHFDNNNQKSPPNGIIKYINYLLL
jgi:hypothetical protein